MNIMLDLETLGNKPGSVIASIGAVKFGGGKIIDEFYRRIDLQSCVDIGLTMDVSAIVWWLEQGEEARKEITEIGEHIGIVLSEFSVWVSIDEAIIWGNGANFDNNLLSIAYDKAKIQRPWKYSNDRCYRTVKALYPDIQIVREGVFHNALNDARSQAKHLMQILPNL